MFLLDLFLHSVVGTSDLWGGFEELGRALTLEILGRVWFMAWEDALCDIFSLVFEVGVEGLGEGLAFLYFSGGTLRSLNFELL